MMSRSVKPPKPCVDCTIEGITTKRKAPHPGPRCVSHNRVKRTQRRAASQEARWLSIYNLTADDYWEIYRFQGGRCYICRRATGARKRLSVDHCHKTGIVRGLLCTSCNKFVLGHLRDSIEALFRAIVYLIYPPAVQAIGIRITPDTAISGADSPEQPASGRMRT